MDFSSLGSISSVQAPIDPIKLFYSLPSLENTPNDLWSGQSAALSKWHEKRDLDDVLVALNTGAGKTIVGSLIAQSLINEDLDNVLYVCSTIDLVKQTANECTRLGIQHTIRAKGQFSNTLFEEGRAFCITTYAALFNGYSTLRRKHFPQAIIFDDAHVAESILRDAFTLRINSKDHPNLFNEIANLFKPHFDELHVTARFRDSLTTEHHATSMVAPRGLYQRKEQLLEILQRHGINDNNEMKYSFSHLEDHLDSCAAIFSRGIFELAPPFLPSLALDIFETSIRRIYLSATLQSQTDFIRAFGKKPTYTVKPSNDAGNGERLVINGLDVQDGFTESYVNTLAQSSKVVVAVPNYHIAHKNWSNVGAAPDTSTFSSDLDTFRNAQSGAFILVSRVDGIDLPHDTCRIMVLEGLPSGTSLLERYQWEFLRMNNVHAVRVANRLAQLFGRINRGRKDYGIFLIQGKDLNAWLSKDKNLSLLPPLLQQQILLGKTVQAGMDIKSHEKVDNIISEVLSRNQSWLNYYEQTVKLGELDQEQLDRATENEPHMIEAALSEAKYAASIWKHDYSSARETLEKTIDQTTRADTPLGGWHAIWLAASYDLEGDSDTADTIYGIAKSRLGSAISLPKKKKSDGSGNVLVCNDFYRQISEYTDHLHHDKFEKEKEKLAQEFRTISDGSPRQAEAGVRKLGELLGFESLRPDNDDNTGPDVLWLDNANSLALGFELKTDKGKSGNDVQYYKKEIAQGHDHISYIQTQYPKHEIIGLLYIGPNGTIDKKGNPSELMKLCFTEKVTALSKQILALIEDFRNYTPLEKIPALTMETEKEKWSLKSLAKILHSKDMSEN